MTFAGFATWLQRTSLLKSEAKQHQIVPVSFYLPVSFSPHWVADQDYPFLGIWSIFVRVFSVCRKYVILVILSSSFHHPFLFYIFCSYVFTIFLCLSLQLDLLFNPCMTFSHVLHKNATDVVQTDLSLPHFLFLLNFGARISCGFSITWSPFFFCQLVTPGISPTCCIYWWFSSWILVELFFFLGCSV